MMATRTEKVIGGFTINKSISPIRGIVTWTGEDGFINSLKAHHQFNEWADELFGKFMSDDDRKIYLDAWDEATNEMQPGGIVDKIIRDPDGFVKCKIHHDEDTTWVKFYKREAGE